MKKLLALILLLATVLSVTSCELALDIADGIVDTLEGALGIQKPEGEKDDTDKEDDKENGENGDTGAYYPEFQVNFAMINDTHGAFVDSTDGDAIGKVDSILAKLTEANGEYIKIHNGDAFQGSYVSGELFGLPIVEALNVMDFDCFVIGNHEFDWGIEKIAAYKDGDESNGEAEFPFLGANILSKATGRMPDWINAYTVIEYGETRVGIIGVIGSGQESSILASKVADYEFTDSLPIIEDCASELRLSHGCDVVVVAAHEYDEELNYDIASLTGDSAVDAIFCAHTHQKISEKLTRPDSIRIPVVQNYHKNNTMAEVIVKLDADGEVRGGDGKIYTLANEEVTERIAALVEKYDYLISEANEVIGYTSGELYKKHLGLVATMEMLEYSYTGWEHGAIDMALINTGGIRATIDAGDITRADVFEVFPFNNTVVLVNIRGKELKAFLSKNIDYLYYSTASGIGSYESFSDSAYYQVALIDYVFENPYYYQLAALTEDNYLLTGIIMRDLLIESDAFN